MTTNGTNVKTTNGADVKKMREPDSATTDLGTTAVEGPDPDLKEIEPSDDSEGSSDASSSEAPDDVKSTLDQAVGAKPPRRSVSISVRGLALGSVIMALVVAVAALGWLYYGARQEVNAQNAQLANEAHAEKVALDYAVNAATMDFKDLQAWHVKLVAGTSPELTKKLTDAGTSMEQVLVPLQWSSIAQPLVAKVRSNTQGIYVVDSFVSVQTKTVQAPDPLQSTATYSTTIDSNNNWQITDVGGIGSAMGPK